MTNITDIVVEVTPGFSNIDIMFKAIIVLAILGLFIGIIYVIYQAF